MWACVRWVGVGLLLLGCGSGLEQAVAKGSEGSEGSGSDGSMVSAPGGSAPSDEAGAVTDEGTSSAMTMGGATGLGDASGSTTEPGTSSASESTGLVSETSGGSSESSTGEAKPSCARLMLPETEPVVCSVDGSQQAQLTIVNDCESTTIETWWVGYGCVEEFMVAVTGPGEMDVVNPTYATHPFRVRDQATGDLMLEIPPLPPGGTVITVP